MYVYILVIATIVLGLSQCEDHENGSLELLFTLFRHGDRTRDASTIYPKDMYKHELYLPYGLEQLTKKGKIRCYGLGQTLRKEYGTFLGPLYVPGLLQPVSTSVERTKCSLQLVLAGLFPPAGTELEWNKNLNWNPIPYSSVDQDKQPVISFPLSYCPKYQLLYNEYVRTPKNIAVEEHYKRYYPYISEHSGLTVRSIIDVVVLAGGLLSEDEWGLTLPEWTKSIYPSVTSKAIIDIYGQLVATPQLNKLYGGFLLKKTINDMAFKINGTSRQTKMYMYSAHDIQVVGLLAALKVYYPHAPAYNACVIIELRKIRGEYYVRVRYNKESTYTFVDMVIPGCQALCPIDDFVNLLHDHIPENDNSCSVKL